MKKYELVELVVPGGERPKCRNRSLAKNEMAGSSVHWPSS
jgi:hypothetical protein